MPTLEMGRKSMIDDVNEYAGLLEKQVPKPPVFTTTF